MAEKLMAMVAKAPTDSFRKKNDDDFSDRLSSRYTVAILGLFTILISLTQYVGQPIVCWAPAHFKGGWTKFANSYCWVKDTYYLPWENDVPFYGDLGEDYKEYVQYYQWIPFILLGQALLFYAPTIVWHAFNSRGGIDADSILQAACKLSIASKFDERNRTLKAICNSMDMFLHTRRTHDKCSCDLKSLVSATLCRPCGKRFGNYLVLLFLLSKLCYIANAIGQFFLLDKILGRRFSLYGFDIMSNGLSADHDWEDNTHVSFPRVTMCDFNIRRLGNINRYSVQCVLPINMYNEKIFLFLWFWMVFVAIVSIINFFIWFTRFLFRGDRMKFLKNHLVATGIIKQERDRELLHRFLDNYLKQDGAFLLRLISHNTNSITTTEITCALWQQWNEKLSKPLTPTVPDNVSDDSMHKAPIDSASEGTNDDSETTPMAPPLIEKDKAEFDKIETL